MWRRLRTRQPSGETPRKASGLETPEAMLRRLSWTVLRPLGASLGGDEPSLVRGSSMEVSEVREYQPGDDVRHIDWNVSARTDQTYVRVAEVERALDVWFLLDVSASVDWGTAECLKRGRAVEFTAVASRLLGGHGNRIAAILFAERPLGFVPPGAGRAHLLRAIRSLTEQPRQAVTSTTDLAGALAHANSVLRRKSLVLVVSDFLVPEGWQPELRKLVARHEVVAVRLRDPRESDIPDIGIITLEDPETGRQLTVDTRNRHLRERFREAARAQSERIDVDLARCGVEHLVLSTDSPLLMELARFLHARRVRGARPWLTTAS